jgi:hypothetical protein
MDKVIFDGENKLIIVNFGITDIDVELDIYSAWKRWLLSADNSKYEIALRVVGGDPISEVKTLGATFFLMNGWRIRPYEGNHRLKISGNIFTDPSGDSIIIPTLGNFSVIIEMFVSNLSDSTLAQMPQFEYSSFNSVVTVDAINGAPGTSYPLGTPSHPVNNLTDAIFIANLRGFKKIYFIGNYTIPSNAYITGFIFAGQGATLTTLTFEPGCIVPNCQAENVRVTGESLGMVGFTNCHIATYAGSGTIPSSQHILVKECLLEGVISLPGNYTGRITVLDSWAISSPNTLVFNMNGGAFSLKNKNFAGDVTIINCTSGLASVSTEFNAGRLILDSSITAGTFKVGGVGICINNSGGSTSVDTSSLMQAREIEFSSFNGGITIDVANGTSGTNFPYGTPHKPVNNFSDAKSIAVSRGFSTYYIKGTYSFNGSEDLSNCTFIGDSSLSSSVIFDDTLCNKTTLKNMLISGTLTDISSADIENCRVLDLNNFSGSMKDCIFLGTIGLCGEANFNGCVDGIPGSGSPIVNLNTSESAGFWRYNGGLELRNCTNSATNVSVNFQTGRVVLTPSITAGTFLIKGVGLCIDNSTGTARVDTLGLISKASVVEVTWNAIYINTEDGIPGTSFPVGTPSSPCSNLADALTIAEATGIKDLYFIGEITLLSPLTNFRLFGNGALDSCICNLNNQLLNTVVFGNCTVKGKLNAYTETGEGWAREKSLVEFRNVHIEAIDGLAGTAVHCQIEGTNKIKPHGWFSAIETVVEGDFTFFDFQNSDGAVSMDVNSGWCQFINAAEGALIELNVKGGEISLYDSCVGGEYYLEGVGTLFNESAMVVKENHFVWDEPMSYHQINGSMGKSYSDNAFNGFVTVDSETGVEGSDFPAGTLSMPCKNFEDAQLVAVERGLSTYYIQSHEITIPSGVNLDHCILKGKSVTHTNIIIEPGVSTNHIRIENCVLTGELSGEGHYLNRVIIDNVTGFSGLCEWYVIRNTISVVEGGTCTFITGWDGAIVGNGVIDCGGENGPEILFRGHYGGLTVVNHTSLNDIAINLIAGSVELESSCNNGRCVLSGIGHLKRNESTMTIVKTGLVNVGDISEGVWSNINALTKNKFIALK